MIIARVWHGLTRESSAEEYLEHLKKIRIRSYREVPGNLGVLVLERVTVGVAEFLVISIWDSYEAIRRFTGSTNLDAAIYQQEDYRTLVFAEPRVTHYEIVFAESVCTDRPKGCWQPDQGEGFDPESSG